MTAHSATAARTRTGGPKDHGPKIAEHVMGWTLVVVIAMLMTQIGLLRPDTYATCHTAVDQAQLETRVEIEHQSTA